MNATTCACPFALMRTGMRFNAMFAKASPETLAAAGLELAGVPGARDHVVQFVSSSRSWATRGLQHLLGRETT